MTTLTKTAVFTFEAGSPFVPEQSVTTCTGTPDIFSPAPPISDAAGAFAAAGALPPGSSGAYPRYTFGVDRWGRRVMTPYCNGGRINTLTGRCL